MSNQMWSIALALPVRLAVFSMLWWVLTEGEGSTWTYAIAVVPLAVLVSLVFLPPRRRDIDRRDTGQGSSRSADSADSADGAGSAGRGGWGQRAVAVVVLTGWFLWQSVQGAVDIAERSLRRPVRIDPGFVTYRWRLPAGAGRIAVMDLLNLMPGSLSVRAEEQVVVVHVVDTAMPVTERLQTLESKVAAVTGQRLPQA
ncbi:MAG TPA: Na+/H+ antiporter subunit E [Beutenbergiaceae bacterium]|nr:Na+/H+ antiporter subunit E [Beutenbergiaceae bacterium]